jgi:thiamine biosynthesis lipoprotein
VAAALRGSGVRRVEPIMGMPILVDAPDAHAEADLDPLFDWFRMVDRRFSTYRADSEISRLNRGELELAHAHCDVQHVVARCEELRAATSGYFDARAGVGGIDPSGLVKGWSVDRAAAIADGLGLRNYAINAGGDIRLRGGSLPDMTWRVGIQDPVDRTRTVAVIESSDIAIATSGAYERGAHIVDPHTGRPPQGVRSVTVTGAELGTTDALATAIFAMGTRGTSWTARLRDHEALTLLEDGRAMRTLGFARTPTS